MLYAPRFVSTAERRAVLDWLATLHPIWEERYSAHNPPPEGATQRRLLRPVYWLGAWQFACLDYYRPPNGVLNRAIRAEAFPPVLATMIEEIEEAARATFPAADIPRGWHLNTCLINFYGA
ncbi:MAG TPA: alpha-ketoglutarate-dependent dioxygenase AlkB, partial [bacterium]|nr:alpha-ketoglutarate-dependent dioxygenase AlkB [bacterium]